MESDLADLVTEEKKEEVQMFANMIHSSHKSVQFEGLISLRRLLSEDDPPMQEVIDSGIIPKILEIMTWEDESKFQIESTRCIGDICSSAKTKFVDYITELGGLDIIISLFDSNVEDIIYETIWAMCHIADVSTKYRDICLEKDCVERLLQIIERFSTSDDIIKHVLYAIWLLCRGKPNPNWEIILPALPVLYKHISDVHSQEALKSALGSLSCIADDNIQEVIDQGCLPFLIQHLNEGDPYLLAPTLRALGNLLTGNDQQTNEVLSYPEFLPKIFEITTHPKKLFRKESLWAFSNIAAGTPEQIEKILENSNYVDRLKTAVATEPQDVAREAAFAICNMISGADPDQVDRMIDKHEILESFPHILRNSAKDLKKEALDVILKILKIAGPERENNIQGVEGLIDAIEGLVELEKDCSIKAELILKYFNGVSKVPKEKEKDEGNQEESEKED